VLEQDVGAANSTSVLLFHRLSDRSWFLEATQCDEQVVDFNEDCGIEASKA